MAVNELSWRKFPRDTMRNEELDYCAYLLGKELAAAPFLFFTTAYCKADDDGVFDIEDGVIFSRLMRLGAPEDVIKIAKLLEDRKIITSVIPGGSIYILNEWEPPVRPGQYSNKSRTAEDRRKAVALKIEAEQRSRQQQQPAAVHVNFSSTPASDPFFCLDVDKNAKSVDRQRERDREIDRETHTQKDVIDQKEREIRETGERSEGFRAYTNALQPCAEEAADKKETQNTQSMKNPLTEAALQGSYSPAVTQPMQPGKKEKSQMYSDIEPVRQVLNTFFTKNCLGYNESQSSGVIKALSERILKLADDKNPPGIIASVFCTQFKNMSVEPGHYQNVAINPEKMLHPEIYAQICSRASRVLLTKDATEEWYRQQKAELVEIEADRDKVYIELEKDCLKYGIDKNDPQAMFKVMLAKKQQAIK